MNAVSTTNYRSAGPVHHDGVVVDLSRFAERLAAYEDISAELTTDEEAKIVSYIKACHDMSHRRIGRRYDHWLEADRAHDVWVPPEATSFREKAVIADTRAIADTVLTYMMAALTGRNPMFQLEGQNRKSRKVAPILERVLHMQMRRTGAEARIAQLLLDSIRYGFAPTKVIWDAKTNQNRIINFDPRRCFPDPRVNWGDWENMGYIIFSDFLAFNSLASSGLYPKLKQFPALRIRQSSPVNGWEGHRFHREEGRGLSIDPAQPLEGRTHQNWFALGDSRVVDEAWVRMAGYEIGIPQIDMIWLVITILDENVVIRFQINPYGQQFPTVIGGLYQDSHKTYSQSLYDILLPMHDVATWLLRSRIDNVQAALNNLIFADPTQVSISDLINRNPWGVVRTLPGAKPGDGVFIAQVPDVTRSHWQDIQAMSELKQRVSAASDAQQGMPTADGIRTATEIARLTQLGSQRLGVLSRIISATTIRPLVNMMVGNIQDALAYSGSIKIDPESMPSQLSDMVEDGYIDFDVAKDLQGQVDYLVIDGTLPIEPTRNAETWMNMLQIMSQTGLNMEYKVGKIAEEGIRALGISDLDRFRISPEERQQGPSPSQQMALMQAAQGATVMPQQQLEQEIQKGNLIPARQQVRQ
jgi:hypothetical protein